jgi:hypothetical protein
MKHLKATPQKKSAMFSMMRSLKAASNLSSSYLWLLQVPESPSFELM